MNDSFGMSMTFNNNATIFRKALEKQFCNKAHKTITKLHKERDFVRGGKGKILFVTEICKTSKQILPGCLLAFFFWCCKRELFYKLHHHHHTSSSVTRRRRRRRSSSFFDDQSRLLRKHILLVVPFAKLATKLIASFTRKHSFVAAFIVHILTLRLLLLLRRRC